MALADLEDLVRLAIDCGLIGTDMRQQLMRTLPAGFVYSLPTVSRPIDQLRFDLMELDRTPRLIGLDRPPLAVWLANAADICVTRGRGDAALALAAEADRLAPAEQVGARVAAALGQGSGGVAGAVAGQSRVGQVAQGSVGVAHGSVGVAHGPVTINNYAAGAPAPAPAMAAARHPVGAAAASAPAVPGFPRERRALVLTMHPDAEMAWRAVEPPLEPQGRVYHAATARGRWFDDYPPHSAVWRHVINNLDDALQKIGREVQPGDCLAIFAKAPGSLGALIGSRLRERLSMISNVTVFEEVALAQPPWRPWGPAWSRPVAPESKKRLALALPRGLDAAPDVALVVQIDELVDDEQIRAALVAAGAPDAPVATLAPSAAGRLTFDAPAAIEAGWRDLRDATDEVLHGRPKVRRLHLFYSGPLALMVRLGVELHARRCRTTVYEFRRDETCVPAVRLGGHQGAAVVERDDMRVPGASDDYDVFISYPGPDAGYANKLYDALTGHRLRVFLDERSLVPGDTWDTALPAALARSRGTVAIVSPDSDQGWYQRAEYQQAIEQMRRAPGAHRILPVLIRGTQRGDLPYELRPLVALEAADVDVYATAARLCELLQRQPSEREVAEFRRSVEG